MHKKYITILILLSFMLLSGCKKSLIDIKAIDFITFTPNDFLNVQSQTFKKDSDYKDEYKFITSLLEDFLVQPTTLDHQNHGDFTINIGYEDKTSRTFYLDLDVEGQKAFLTEGQSTHLISGEKYSVLISSSVFSPFMKPSYEIPKMILYDNNKAFTYIGAGTYYFRSFNTTKQTIPYQTEIQSLEPFTVHSKDASTLNFVLDKAPSEVIENLYKDEELLQSIPLTDTKLILPSEEGPYTIELVCKWNNFNTEYFEGTSTYRFLVYNDLPVEFSVTQAAALPGDCFVITAKNVAPDQVLKVTAPFYNEEVSFIPYKEYFIGILPIYAWVTPQKYILRASTTDPKTGTQQITEHSVEVQYKFFDIQHLTVTEDTLALRSQENIASDEAYLKEARSNSRPEKLWDGNFIQPVDGIITTEYSETRYTNDNPVPSRHSGIDIAIKRGTSVQASNNGYVTMSKSLYLTGNTVVVDHGMGIFTAYCHLDEISVAQGDYVKKGDIVGTVGTTGFSTGPHLHFTFYINGTYVNPWTFFERDLLDF